MSGPRWEVEGRDWPNRDASRFVTVGTLDWHVQEIGDGPIILMLHGTGAATHSWRDLVPLLAGNHRVVAIDLPGHGFTKGRPPGGLTLPAMARAVAALLTRLELEPRCLVGHSAGAAIAVRMALDELVAPAGIVGLGAALMPFPGLGAAIFPGLAKLLFANPFAPHLFSGMARGGDTAAFLRRSTGSTSDARGVELYARLIGNAGHTGGALAMMAAWDLAPLARDLPKLATPLLLLHGERDSAIAPASAREASALTPGATFETLPALGHLAHEENPELIAARISVFMAAIEGGADAR